MKVPELLKKVRGSVSGVFWLPDFPKYEFENVQEVLQVAMSGPAGSAFAVQEHKALTCSHVLEPALNKPGSFGLVVYSPDGIRTSLATKIETDKDLDCAFLEVERELSPLTLDFEPPEPGTDVVVVGFPLPEGRHRVKEGHIAVNVHFVQRATRGIVATAILPDGSFEVDVQFNPGLSGGPVLDVESGHVVGMAQRYRNFPQRETSFPTDLGLATPMTALRARLQIWGIV